MPYRFNTETTNQGTVYVPPLLMTNIANAAGSGAGQSVTTTVTLPAGLPPNFPANHGVLVMPTQPCMWSVNLRNGVTFQVTLTPPSGVTFGGRNL